MGSPDEMEDELSSTGREAAVELGFALAHSST
jgi:hypothetical protein